MTSAEYQFQHGFEVTDDMVHDFNEHGYVMVRGLIRPEEIQHLTDSLNKGGFMKHTYGIDDGDGKEAHVILWNNPGDDVTGMVSRSEKVAGTCEKLLGGEVYHYHSKLLKKPPEIGGKHIWHQDYGYWYKNGNLFPDMLTVFIAIDNCTKSNGCLQILRGSHKCGRVDHVWIGGQTGADMERVTQVMKKCPLEYVEMKSGDALFFHCNLLHSSSDNQSTERRWAFLCAFNRADNDPVYDHHHPHYTPLKKVDDSEIMRCTNLSLEGKDFMNYAKRTKESGTTGRYIGDEKGSR